MYDVLLVRYGEIAIKGKNRHVFENKLVENMHKALKDVESARVERARGRLYVTADVPAEELAKRLKSVFGIVSMSPAARVKSDIEDIKAVALKVLEDACQALSGDSATFKVVTRRANKAFPLTSPEINRTVGAHLLKNGPESLSVDVHQPQITVSIEVREKHTYVYGKTISGYGGLPVGTSGTGVLLLSGGIDSPVAGWYALKRGVRIIPIHFHSFPFTSDRAKQKVVDLARILTRYGGTPELHVVHFTDIQTAIQQHCPPDLLITIMRRFMVRLGERIAEQNGAQIMVTGESLGQVASQTVPSIVVTEAATQMPIIRPLVAFDKREIVDVAREIGTYETSILPYEDCCTIFVPKHPETKPRVKVVEEAEQALDIERLIADALARTEIVRI